MPTHSSEPGVVSHKRHRRRRDCAPPKAPDAVFPDPLAEQSEPVTSLGLEGHFHRVDWGQRHSEEGCAIRSCQHADGLKEGTRKMWRNTQDRCKDSLD
jgi:hypothetical protein